MLHLQGIPIHNGLLVIGEPGEYTDVRRKRQKGKGGGELLLAVVDTLNPKNSNLGFRCIDACACACKALTSALQRSHNRLQGLHRRQDRLPRLA